jgi:hypothetical protein
MRFRTLFIRIPYQRGQGLYAFSAVLSESRRDTTRLDG